MTDPLDGAAADGERPLQRTEVLAMRVDLEFVPEWSNVVERIARHHGERVAVGVEGGQLVIEVAVTPEKKPRLMGEMQRFWSAFVDRRKKEGRWKV